MSQADEPNFPYPTAAAKLAAVDPVARSDLTSWMIPTPMRDAFEDMRLRMGGPRRFQAEFDVYAGVRAAGDPKESWNWKGYVLPAKEAYVEMRRVVRDYTESVPVTFDDDDPSAVGQLYMNMFREFPPAQYQAALVHAMSVSCDLVGMLDELRDLKVPLNPNVEDEVIGLIGMARRRFRRFFALKTSRGNINDSDHVWCVATLTIGLMYSRKELRELIYDTVNMMYDHRYWDSETIWVRELSPNNFGYGPNADDAPLYHEVVDDGNSAWPVSGIEERLIRDEDERAEEEARIPVSVRGLSDVTDHEADGHDFNFKYFCETIWDDHTVDYEAFKKTHDTALVKGCLFFAVREEKTRRLVRLVTWNVTLPPSYLIVHHIAKKGIPFRSGAIRHFRQMIKKRLDPLSREAIRSYMASKSQRLQARILYEANLMYEEALRARGHHDIVALDPCTTCIVPQLDLAGENETLQYMEFEFYARLRFQPQLHTDLMTHFKNRGVDVDDEDAVRAAMRAAFSSFLRFRYPNIILGERGMLERLRLTGHECEPSFKAQGLGLTYHLNPKELRVYLDAQQVVSRSVNRDELLREAKARSDAAFEELMKSCKGGGSGKRGGKRGGNGRKNKSGVQTVALDDAEDEKRPSREDRRPVVASLEPRPIKASAVIPKDMRFRPGDIVWGDEEEKERKEREELLKRDAVVAAAAASADELQSKPKPNPKPVHVAPVKQSVALIPSPPRPRPVAVVASVSSARGFSVKPIEFPPLPVLVEQKPRAPQEGEPDHGLVFEAVEGEPGAAPEGHEIEGH